LLGVTQREIGLAYLYYEEEPGRRSAAKLLTKDRGAADGGEHRQATDLMCAKDCGEYRKIA
jgi:hypothetical protein